MNLWRLGSVLLLAVATVVGAVASRRDAPSGTPMAARLGSVSIHAQLDRSAVLLGGDGEVRLELVLDGHAQKSVPSALWEKEAARVATDFIVVLDRSGSMQGGPLAHAKAAIHEILGALQPDDRFSLVTYASESQLLLPLQYARAGLPALWQQQVSQVVARGGTNLSRGLDLALSQLGANRNSRRVARVLLLSDGHANEGDASAEGLQRRARVVAEQGALLSAAGVGVGFDEAVMGGLADAGTGNFYYVRHAEDLASVMSGEFQSARATVATALEIHLSPAPGVEVRSAAGYPLETRGDQVVFRPGALAAGQERRLWVTLHAPAGRAGTIALAKVRVRFREAGDLRDLALPEPISVACVEDSSAYYAGIDAERLESGLLEEGLGALKQQVAQAVSAGNPEEAQREINAFAARSRSLFSSLGYEDAEPALAADALSGRVAEAFADSPSAASPAKASRQNLLSKELVEEGRDQRRAGAKQGGVSQ